MFIDARSITGGTAIEADVCIVGAGAAGIAIARELISSGLRIALLEGGDLDYDEQSQALYAGRNIGRRYFDPQDIRLRLRFFGGTTNHWGGWCSLPDALDFERRPGIPYSGWPFPRAYLDPWYRRAQTVLQLGPFDYKPADWGITPDQIPQPFMGPDFVCQVLQVSPPTRFAQEYGPELRKAASISVYFNANALRFNLSESGHEVKDLAVGVAPDRILNFSARHFVLAAGGIENARLLLLSGVPGANGLGNQNDLVGRFFMVHMEYPGGAIVLGDPYTDFKFETDEYGSIFNQRGVDLQFVSYICLSEDTRRKLNLPQLRVLFGKPWGSAVEPRGEVLHSSPTAYWDTGKSERLKRIQFEQSPFKVIPFYCSSEQFPNPDSRIGLGVEKDRFGQRTVTVNWQPSPVDKRGMLAAHRLLGAEVGRVGLGRVWSTVPTNDNRWPLRMFGNQHNIGTTRMNRDPKNGVVDEDCRVHEVSNLYVAGSSVFPTEGTNNPTLTIVALALRLADHIKERLK